VSLSKNISSKQCDIFSVACLENIGASSFPGAIKITKKFGLVEIVDAHKRRNRIWRLNLRFELNNFLSSWRQ